MRLGVLKIGLILGVVCGLVWVGCQAHNMSDVKTSPRGVDEDLYEEELEEPTKIVINVPARELTLFKKKRKIFEFPIAVGARGFKTPIGQRFVRKIVWNPWWIPPNSPWARGSKPTPPGPKNPLGPVKMDLGRAILLHGTSNERSIGRAVSHGCMRMFNTDAKKIAWWIQKRFTEKNDSSILDQYRRNSGQSFHVMLTSPLSVEVEYDIFKIENGYFESYPDLYGKVGNRKKKAYKELVSAGFSRHRISDTALTRLLKLSESKTARISLRELMPGRLAASSKRVPDPVDEAWRRKNI